MNEVFVFWNGKVVFDTLMAVVGIFGTGDFLGLLRGVVIAALLAAATYAVLSQRGSVLISHFAWIFIGYMVLFVPKQTVIVNDLRTAQVYTVSNVPIGLAVPYATISRVGWWLTMQYETRFSLPDDQRFSRTGMVFGARLAEALSAQNYPAELKADLGTFYKDCIVPELQDYPAKLSGLRKSSDLMTLLASSSFLNPGRGTVLGSVTNPATGDTAMSCTAVPGALNQYVATHPSVANDNFAWMGSFLRPQELTTQAALAGLIENDTNNMLGTMTSISSSALEALNQTMMINALHDADFAMRNGYGSAAATSYAAAVTENSARQAGYTGKLWAEKALPLTRNVAEIVLIAIFPLVLLLVLMAGERALAALKLYFGALLSLALWAPLTAILNFVIISNGIDSANALLAASQGFTINNINAWVDMNLATQAVAGQMFLLVPVIAFGLVTGGGYAVTQAVGSVTAAGGQASGSASGGVAQGNLSAGQVSWSNTSALNTSTGQSNTAPSFRGGFVSNETAGGTQVFGAASSAGGGMGQTISNMRGDQLGAVGASINRSLQNAYSQSAESSLGVTRSALSEVSNSIKQATGSGWRNEGASQLASRIDSVLSNGSSSDLKRMASEAQEFAQTGGFSSQRSQIDSRSTSANAGAGLRGAGGKAPAGSDSFGKSVLGGGFDVGTGINATDSLNSVGQLGQSGSIRQGGSQSASTGETHSQSASVGNSATNTSSSSTASYGSLDRAKDAANRASASAQAAQRATEALSATRSDAGSVNSGIARQVIDRMGGHDAAMRLANQDMGSFNAAAERAAMGVVQDQGLGPAASRQVQGASGSAATSGSMVQANMASIERPASSQLHGAPEAAKAPGGAFRDPETGGMASAGGGSGGTAAAGSSNHASPRTATASTRTSSSTPAGGSAGGSQPGTANEGAADRAGPRGPVAPPLPESVPAAGDQSGTSRVHGNDVRGDFAAQSERVRDTVSDGNAETLRKASRAQGDGKSRTER